MTDKLRLLSLLSRKRRPPTEGTTGEFRPLIPLNLHFFDEGDKTEKPTPRKKKKSREEGQVAKSQEIGTAFLFLVAFFGLRVFAGRILNGVLALFNYQWVMLADVNQIFDAKFSVDIVVFLFQQIILIILPLFLLVMVVGVITNLIQVGWTVTTKPLQPKFSKLNPLKGFKRIFSLQSLITLAKSLLKFALIGAVVYNVLKKELSMIPDLFAMELGQSMGYIGNLVVDMGLMVGALYILIAALDYAYARYKHMKQLKMTKQEIKEEYKNTEGNPQIKGKIRQKMREISQ